MTKDLLFFGEREELAHFEINFRSLRTKHPSLTKLIYAERTAEIKFQAFFNTDDELTIRCEYLNDRDEIEVVNFCKSKNFYSEEDQTPKQAQHEKEEDFLLATQGFSRVLKLFRLISNPEINDYKITGLIKELAPILANTRYGCNEENVLHFTLQYSNRDQVFIKIADLIPSLNEIPSIDGFLPFAVFNLRNVTSRERNEDDDELLTSIALRDIDKFKTLLSRGANINTQDNSGNGVMHYLARNKTHLPSFRMYQLLMSKYGVSVTTENKKGENSLDFAFEYDNLRLLSFAETNLKIDPYNIAHSNNENMGHIVARKGDAAKLKFLLERDVNLFVRNNKDQLPIDVAREQRDIILENIAHLTKTLSQKPKHQTLSQQPEHQTRELKCRIALENLKQLAYSHIMTYLEAKMKMEQTATNSSSAASSSAVSFPSLSTILSSTKPLPQVTIPQERETPSTSLSSTSLTVESASSSANANSSQQTLRE